MTRLNRPQVDQQNDIRDVDRFVSALTVFALHGRTNGLEPDACEAMLMLVNLMLDPVGRLMKDHGVRSER